jgi:hypothetical protein
MNYTQELIDRIKDSGNWPSFNRPDFLVDLNTVADEAFEKATVEGCLAALLIYHQLCEELAHLILRDAQFYIQLSVFPAEIDFPQKKILMFGNLIKELRSTISFKNKDAFVERCLELNRHRIDIVHRLTKRTTLSSVQLQVSEAKRLFDEIYDLFEDTHDFFRVCFHSFRKDVDWDDYLEEL